MKTLLISGGKISSDFALAFMREQKPDYIIAADRGLLFADRYGITPDLIVGDFDSTPCTVVDRYRASGQIPIRTYDPVKDATDTQIALEAALEAGSDEILIIGGTGTRLDHVLGNIAVLQIALQAGKYACLADETNLVSLVGPGRVEKLIRQEQFGTYVSFLPFGGTAHGVTLRGFRYPLEDACLMNGSSLGVSNEITATEASVSVASGILIMIQSRD